MQYPSTYGYERYELASVLWMDANIKNHVLLNKDVPKSAKQLIKETIGDFSRGQIIDTIFGKTPLRRILTGDIAGILSVIATSQESQQWYLLKSAFNYHSKVRVEVYYRLKSGNWGVTCIPYVNIKEGAPGWNTYWDGKKSSIATKYIYDYSNALRIGSTEYFYR